MAANELPTTAEAAVRVLQDMIPQGELARIAAMSESELITLHAGLGQWIRNHLGLWRCNAELLTATGERNADDASAIIIRVLWQRLRDELPKLH